MEAAPSGTQSSLATHQEEDADAAAAGVDLTDDAAVPLVDRLAGKQDCWPLICLVLTKLMICFTFNTMDPSCLQSGVLVFFPLFVNQLVTMCAEGD